MNVGTFPTILVALPESSEKLAILPLSCQPESSSVQAPPHFLTRQYTGSFLWISNKLVTIANPDISANIEQICTRLKFPSIYKIQMCCYYMYVNLRLKKKATYSSFPITNLLGM